MADKRVFHSGIARWALCAASCAFGAAGAGAYAATVEGAAAPPSSAKVLADFTRKTGKYPGSGVILASDGNFYGTTSRRGAFGRGTLYRMSPSGDIVTLHDFAGMGDGINPEATLVQGTDGALYGSSAGSDDLDETDGAGVIFRMTLDGVFTALHVVPSDGSEGYDVGGGYPLIQARDGNLYGNHIFGGAFGRGTLFRISTSGEFAVVASYPANGGNVIGPPLEGDDGNFYLTSYLGGAFGFGQVFSVTPDGVVTGLYNFKAGVDGASPSQGLLYDAEHMYMYGVTGYEARNGCATAFRYRSGKVETTARLLTQNAPGRLSLGPDGVHFYTSYDHAVYSFAPGADPRLVAQAPGTLVQAVQFVFDGHGALYGTTLDGGTKRGGTVFKIKKP